MNGSMEHLLRDAVRSEMRRQQLMGFSNPTRIALDVEPGADKGGTYCWGVWNRDTKSLDPEYASALTGTLEGICLKETEYEGETGFKLALYLDCGSTQYSLRSGLKTSFSRGVMLRLLDIPWQKGQLVRIAVQTGTKKSTTVLPSVSLYNSRTGRFEWIKTEQGKLPPADSAPEMYAQLIRSGYYEIGSGSPVESEEPAAATQLPPKPQANPAPVSVPVSSNYKRISEIKQRTGHTTAQAKQAIVGDLQLLDPDNLNSDNLTAPQMLELRDYLYADWAVGRRAFNSIEEAKEAIATFFKQRGALVDEDAWAVWSKRIEDALVQ